MDPICGGRRVVVEHDFAVVDVTSTDAIVIDELVNNSFTVDPETKEPAEAEGSGNALRDTVQLEELTVTPDPLLTEDAGLACVPASEDRRQSDDRGGEHEQGAAGGGEREGGRQDESAGEPVRRGHERGPAPRRASRKCGMAHRQEVGRGIAGERVADAHAAVA